MDWNKCLDKDTGAATLQCIPVVFANLVNAALVFVGSVAVIFIIVAGMRYITAGGDPKRAESARKTLTFAIIGLLIVVFAFIIVNTVADVTGAKCIKIFSFDSCQ